MKSILLGATALAAVALAPAAHATLQFAAVVNGVNFFCADQQACDQNLAIGTLALADGLTLGGVITNGSLSVSNLGNANLNSSNFSLINLNGTAVTVVVAVGDNNFVGPRTAFSFSGSGTFSNAVGATINDTWWDDPANVQPATTQAGPLVPGDTPGNQLGSDTFTATLLSDAFAFTSGGIQQLANPDGALFSMTLGASITLPGSTLTGTAACSSAATQVTNCAQLVGRSNTLTKFAPAVPEPISLSLLGVGLIGIGMVRRHKRQAA